MDILLSQRLQVSFERHHSVANLNADEFIGNIVIQLQRLLCRAPVAICSSA